MIDDDAPSSTATPLDPEPIPEGAGEDHVRDFGSDGSVRRYCSPAYGLSLEIPQTWEMSGGVRDEYVAAGRLLQIGAIGGQGRELEEIVSLEIDHSLQPYGTDPSVSLVSLYGADAALVIPSEDAPGNSSHPATGVLIIKPADPVVIGDARYNFITVRFDQASSEFALSAELEVCPVEAENRAA